MERITLRDGWFTSEVQGHIDLNASGVYEWRIEGIGVYVGKAKRLKDRLTAYPRNVRRMLEGRPWHGNPQKDYRRVHHALRRAYDEGHLVTFSVLEVCSADERKDREDAWRRIRKQEETAGSLPVLND